MFDNKYKLEIMISSIIEFATHGLETTLGSAAVVNS